MDFGLGIGAIDARVKRGDLRILYVPFGHWEVDLLRRGYGLAVEVDGYSSSSSVGSPLPFQRWGRPT